MQEPTQSGSGGGNSFCFAPKPQSNAQSQPNAAPPKPSVGLPRFDQFAMTLGAVEVTRQDEHDPGLD